MQTNAQKVDPGTRSTAQVLVTTLAKCRPTGTENARPGLKPTDDQPAHSGTAPGATPGPTPAKNTPGSAPASLRLQHGHPGQTTCNGAGDNTKHSRYHHSVSTKKPWPVPPPGEVDRPPQADTVDLQSPVVIVSLAMEVVIGIVLTIGVLIPWLVLH